jgi:hypothetical protein
MPRAVAGEPNAKPAAMAATATKVMVIKRVTTTLLHFGCVAVIQICSATTPPRNSVIRKKQKGSNY